MVSLVLSALFKLKTSWMVGGGEAASVPALTYPCSTRTWGGSRSTSTLGAWTWRLLELATNFHKVFTVPVSRSALTATSASMTKVASSPAQAHTFMIIKAASCGRSACSARDEVAAGEKHGTHSYIYLPCLVFREGPIRSLPWDCVLWRFVSSSSGYGEISPREDQRRTLTKQLRRKSVKLLFGFGLITTGMVIIKCWVETLKEKVNVGNFLWTNLFGIQYSVNFTIRCNSGNSWIIKDNNHPYSRKSIS